jgi:hypothetical protein
MPPSSHVAIAMVFVNHYGGNAEIQSLPLDPVSVFLIVVRELVATDGMLI